MNDYYHTILSGISHYVAAFFRLMGEKLAPSFDELGGISCELGRISCEFGGISCEFGGISRGFGGIPDELGQSFDELAPSFLILAPSFDELGGITSQTIARIQ